MTTEDIDVKALLNAQTGKLEWSELQRHFARGRVLKASPDLDLVEVGARIVEDDKAALEAWSDTGQVSRAVDDDAKKWEAERPLFWVVVVAPWVLVQEIGR